MTARVSADLPRTLLVMAGGTGGHIFPALSVARLLAARGWQVVWLGNASGMEGQLVPKHGFPLESVRFGGVRGKGLVTKFLLPLNLLRAFWQSLGVVRRVRPSVVLGMGGYITFPGGMMSVLLGAPLVLHEQNSIAGLANRVLARVADRVLCAFPGALPGAEWVGNPIRADLAALPSPQARYAERSGPLRVLVVGAAWAPPRSMTWCPGRWPCCPPTRARSSSTRPAPSRSTRCAPTTPPWASTRRTRRPCPSSTTWPLPMRRRIW